MPRVGRAGPPRAIGLRRTWPSQLDGKGTQRLRLTGALVCVACSRGLRSLAMLISTAGAWVLWSRPGSGRAAGGGGGGDLSRGVSRARAATAEGMVDCTVSIGFNERIKDVHLRTVNMIILSTVPKVYCSTYEFPAPLYPGYHVAREAGRVIDPKRLSPAERRVRILFALFALTVDEEKLRLQPTTNSAGPSSLHPASLLSPFIPFLYNHIFSIPAAAAIGCRVLVAPGSPSLSRLVSRVRAVRSSTTVPLLPLREAPAGAVCTVLPHGKSPISVALRARFLPIHPSVHPG